jgi:hypothetical protein
VAQEGLRFFCGLCQILAGIERAATYVRYRTFSARSRGQEYRGDSEITGRGRECRVQKLIGIAQRRDLSNIRKAPWPQNTPQTSYTVHQEQLLWVVLSEQQSIDDLAEHRISGAARDALRLHSRTMNVRIGLLSGPLNRATVKDITRELTTLLVIATTALKAGCRVGPRGL